MVIFVGPEASLSGLGGTTASEAACTPHLHALLALVLSERTSFLSCGTVIEF